MVAGERAKSPHERSFVEELPQAPRAQFCEGMLDVDGASEPADIVGGVVPPDAGKPVRLRRLGHCPISKSRRQTCAAAICKQVSDNKPACPLCFAFGLDVDKDVSTLDDGFESRFHTVADGVRRANGHGSRHDEMKFDKSSAACHPRP